jgi:hypothetical protein
MVFDEVSWKSLIKITNFSNFQKNRESLNYRERSLRLAAQTAVSGLQAQRAIASPRFPSFCIGIQFDFLCTKAAEKLALFFLGVNCAE